MAKKRNSGNERDILSEIYDQEMPPSLADDAEPDLPLRDDEPVDGPPYYIIPPEVFAEVPEVQAVIAPLQQLASDPKRLKPATRKAIAQLADNPEGVLAFFKFCPPHRRRRGSMLFPPTLSPEMVAAHHTFYRSALVALCQPHGKGTAPDFGPLTPAIRTACLYGLKMAFDEDGSPIHAWRAFRVCHASGKVLPAWVAAYFDRCADRLENLVGISMDEVAPHVAAALELTDGEAGRGSPISDVAQDEKEKRTFILVHQRMETGKSLTQSIREVALILNMSESAARTHYYHIQNSNIDTQAVFSKKPANT